MFGISEAQAKLVTETDIPSIYRLQGQIMAFKNILDLKRDLVRYERDMARQKTELERSN